MIVSSDFGGLKKTGRFAEKLHLPLANIDKRRDLQTGKVEARAITGDVAGKTAVIFDDLINGGSTAIEAARILREHNAAKVRIYATHALLAGDASARLQASALDEVVVTDTIDTTEKTFPKLRVLSVASIFAQELTQWAR